MSTEPAALLQEQLTLRWDKLGSPGSEGKVRTIDLPSPTGDGPLLLGRSTAGRSLLIPFGRDEHKAFRDDRRSAAVQLIRRPLEVDGADRWFAELVCMRGELDGVFAAFVADVIARISESPAKRPVRVAAEALAHWRSLFRGARRRLGPQQLRGLFAELVLLRRLAETSDSAVEVWTGPLRKPHDFRLGGWAVEVKAGGVGETRVRIHGVGQLDPPPEGNLALAHFQLAEAEDGETLPEIVAAARELLGPTPLMLRLELAGYQTLDDEHYASTRLRVEQETWYAVDDRFPRIIESSFLDSEIPAGVEAVDYDVDLALASPRVLGASEVARYLAGLGVGE